MISFGEMNLLLPWLLLSLVLTVKSRDNLAIYKPTLQSSSLSGFLDGQGSADHGVDANINGDYSAFSCTHTMEGYNLNWWMVDLQKVYFVTSVRITNRDDCCAERLQNFTVELSVNEPQSLVGFPGLTNSLTCLERVFDIPGRQTEYMCSRPTLGRYLRVIKYGFGALALCEVEVFGEQRHWFKKIPNLSQSFHTVYPMSMEVLDCARLCLHSRDTVGCQFIQWNRKGNSCQLLTSPPNVSGQIQSANYFEFYELV